MTEFTPLASLVGGVMIDFHLPTRSDIDARIVAGPAILGIDRGLGGFCP